MKFVLSSLFLSLSLFSHLVSAQKPIDDDSSLLSGDFEIDEKDLEANPGKSQFASSDWFVSASAGATIRSFVESNPRALFAGSLARRLTGRNILGLKLTSANESRSSADTSFKLNVLSGALYYARAVDQGIFEGVEFGPVIGLAVVDYLSESVAGGTFALKAGQAFVGARGGLTLTLTGPLALLFEVELLGYFSKPQNPWIALNPSLGLRCQW